MDWLANPDTDMKEHFENENNYDLKPIGYLKRRGMVFFIRKYKIRVRDAVMGMPAPVWIDANGDRWTTRTVVKASDLGSIPPDLQCFAGDNSGHELPFIFHDDAVSNGGLYRTRSGVTEFIKIPRTRADQMLYSWIRADDGGRWEAIKIWSGASLGTLWSLLKR